MHGLQFIWTMLLLCLGVCRALDCKLNEGDPYKVAYTITVDQSGHGNFTTLQQAIDSVPPLNTGWIRILISPGTYKEKVTIPANKPCIFLDGAGRPSIEWGDHETTDTRAAFTFYPDNIVARGLIFKNTYNLGPSDDIKVVPALAVRIYGDKSAFYNCSFVGMQDTLWDATGRHYFNNCYIEGAVDFIFGYAQSIYERCEINVNIGKYLPSYLQGYITAQGRGTPEDTSGFVFNSCVVSGSGKTYLGRAYGPYSRVIFYKTFLSDVIVPQGWDAWSYGHHEGNLTYVEADCSGPGANTSKRVPWLKKASEVNLTEFTSISFIDQDGWMANLPKLF